MSTPVAGFFIGATVTVSSANPSLLFPALSTAHTFTLLVTFACVVFDGIVINWVNSSNSVPPLIVYINLPNPLGLTDSPSLNVAFNFTILVLLPSTVNVGAFGFTVSIFAYAGLIVHSPLFPALSTALT